MPAEIFGPDYPFLKSSEQLSFDEIIRIARISESLGVEKIRLTGGEPLMRRKVPELLKRLTQETNIKDIALTTNGLLLPRVAAELKACGLKRVNLSLDALDPETFRKMSGGFGELKQILKAVEVCNDLEIPLKINTVLRKGVNDSQILPLLEFGIKQRVEIRFIEYMDVGCSNAWDESEVIRESDILNIISASYGEVNHLPTNPTAVARTFQIVSASYVFGVIASITRPFCGGCVRGRISSDGKLYTCLFSNTGYDLKSVMRNGISDADLLEKFANIWRIRSDRYSELRDGLDKSSEKIEMSYIGG